jgi:hypothetical protein
MTNLWSKHVDILYRVSIKEIDTFNVVLNEIIKDLSKILT